MLVYVEFRSRKPGVELEDFHAVVGRRDDRWVDKIADDILLLHAGRTWRIGPEPEYLTIYYTPGSGLERLSDWEEIFASGAVRSMEASTRVTGRIDAAGCYVPLIDPIPASGARYYIEYFDIPDGAGRAEVAAWYRLRATQHENLTLHLLADRIGLLGPDPRGLAIWGIPGYHALEAVALELEDLESPIKPVRAGLYADIGEEIV
ncbi:MAG: hypothetical protein U0R50_13440 [Gaiellales bacterium]